jgi:YhcG PDDEXK nuclease domain
MKKALIKRVIMGNPKLSAVLRELHNSIGVLLCHDKDDEVVEYLLSRNLSPILIAKYQFQLPDKKLIQAKLHELFTHVLDGDDEAQQGGGL